MSAGELYWLPKDDTWVDRLAALDPDPAKAWTELVQLANCRIDAVRTERLGRVLTRRFPTPPAGVTTKPVRLALLGSATMEHLHAAIRIAALRRGVWLTIYESDYGQYLPDLEDRSSGLYGFAPDAILLAFDAHHLARGLDLTAGAEAADRALDETFGVIQQCWQLARANVPGLVLQQTALPIHAGLLGSNEHRLAGSAHRHIERLNARIREHADAAGVDLVSVDHMAARAGIDAWHNPVLWHRAKQEVSPTMAPWYGDLVGRILAAKQGLSAKCLVLDLDNTIWGGVIGDDGLSGIVLGQGSAAGEAFASFQHYALKLAKRGIILAVCSKNDAKNALEAFESHPEMLLKRSDIASFVVNWTDKASNLRQIATELNIGLDALVFVDDNPFERNLVRQEVPMVKVPEVPDDPSAFERYLSDAGYFEAVSLTGEDLARVAQYQANLQRESQRAAITDMPSYLRSLEMVLLWRPIDAMGMQRVVQLINKTNQFNLTTYRHGQGDVEAILMKKGAFGLQLRLVDRYGDNGMISVVIGKPVADDIEIDSWLMSCRVLGRGVEEATLNLVTEEARRAGARRVIGKYRPTAKNAMVKDHYEKLGFGFLSEAPDGTTAWALDIESFSPKPAFIEIREG